MVAPGAGRRASTPRPEPPIKPSTMSENRRFYRLAGEWSVVCQPLDGAGVPGPSIGGRTRNISAGGAELALQEPVEAGTRMTVRLAAGDLRLYVEATVVRSDDGNVAGVRFEDLDRTQRADLSRFVL